MIGSLVDREGRGRELRVMLWSEHMEEKRRNPRGFCFVKKMNTQAAAREGD